MPPRVTPMIHVPDVQATAAWYASIGFEVAAVHDDGDEVDWADLRLGEGRVMLNAGGRRSTADRREVDLYVEVEGVDGLHRRLKDRVEVVEAPHETFYGMREFIIRDLNGYWITFGEPGTAPERTRS